MTDQLKITRVAVLGTGIMGAPIAKNLALKGFEVRVWNRTKPKAEALASDGIQVADTPEEAVRNAQVVLTVLNDGETVGKAIRAAAAGMEAGTLWAQMSTVGEAMTKSLAKLAAELKVVFYDSPVQGSKAPAEQAQLVILASGPVHTRDKIEAVYNAIGRKTVWVSNDGAEAASNRLKLALNHYAFTLTHGIAESLRLAKALGVDPKLVLDVVTGGPMDNAYFQMKGAGILAEVYGPSFTVTNALKDARLILEAAEGVGMQADVARASADRFQRAVEQGHGEKDMAASALVS
ncbi:3-hydroxyisobutyrate dehydrogenase [Ensifer sp. Root31]|uniref:NAD(P)-dependent oxidoreductase n=1 Tax=Ensifer sp. Root31 TaxID=1736512 RepID=UPI00071124FB|nr:NAD(P)-dependent oxidoreductase [Ensifer sp. Root31]KQU85630.1 3-hydroxyisobutyrate dehydrogenase [Ensifer sp. Root31]